MSETESVSEGASRGPDSSGPEETGDAPSLARFVLKFGLFVGIYFAFASTEYFETNFFEPYLALNARVCGFVLTLLGHEGVSVVGNAVMSPVYAVTIDRGCDASAPIALYVSLILAFPIAWMSKVPALAVGVPALVLLNGVRLVTLFLIGAHYPDLFYVMHTDVWQVVFILAALGLWAGWLSWITPRMPGPAHGEA